MTPNQLLNQLLDQPQEEDLSSLCWKRPQHEMRVWAEECQQQGCHHGLGDLKEYFCQPQPQGTECPACGYIWRAL